ncbi:MAG: PHP domain-containing protein [Clostridiales bacterium]|nr:MAG: PHP domain-containing protein [Clostridiales bacterium]
MTIFNYDIHGGTAEQRLEALRQYASAKGVAPFKKSAYTNNHIHTFYSFSPYSPTEAVYMAKAAGLSSAGIVDHDTMAGAREFLAAGEILNLPTTVGAECRVSFADTELSGYRLNSPDQLSVAYMVLHSVPHKYIETVTDFFAPYRAKRNLRNFEMVQKLNKLLDCALDFERDVLTLSKHSEGGSVTERHLMYALAHKIVVNLGKGQPVVDYLMKELAIHLSDKLVQRLNDVENDYYLFDLLGVLKSNFLPRIFIAASDELPSVKALIDFAADIDAILAYAYLGDVEESVTGDKPKQTFEDAYLEQLFETLRTLHIKALTYMPTRNTAQQLKRVQQLCRQYSMLEISGEDVNSPRQSFICEQLTLPDFKHLSESTWHLIEHERK